MPVLGSPQAGMMPAPCREGGGGRRSEEAGDAGLETRRSETRKHAGRRHRSTQDGDTGARRTETRGHAGQRRGSTQDGDGGDTQTQMGPQPAKLRQIRNPLPYFVPEFSPLRTLQTKGPVAKTTGPRFNVRCGYSSAATGSSVAAADSHDEQSVHSPAGSAHAAGSTAAGSETAAGSPAGSSVTARNSASSVWSS